jgi:hypothetical protein
MAAAGRWLLLHPLSIPVGPVPMLASPRTNLETMLKVTLIAGEGHGGGVRGDIYRVHYRRVGGGDSGLVGRRDRFGCHRLSLKQASDLSEVRRDLLP